MKKLFHTEYDYPVHLAINGAGSDKMADYSDGKECGSSDPFDI